MADIVNELQQNINGEYSICRWVPVAVKPWGSSGCIPIDGAECQFKGEISCVSGSGDSMCGSYMGHLSSNVIRCAFFIEKEKNT